jgi:hypothetical protein
MGVLVEELTAMSEANREKVCDDEGVRIIVVIT